MKKYLITSPEFYTDTKSLFTKKLQEQFICHQPDFALYRDKSNKDYDILAKAFMKICSNFQTIKSFIHQNVELASKLDADGVHLTCNALEDIKKAKGLGLEVIVSTHTYAEVQEAEELGADYVTYSPIFYSLHKGEPKGIKDLEKLVKISKIKIFALGGIVEEEEVCEVAKTKVYGFASIRYFKKK